MKLPPALLASLKILSSIIKAKNVLDLELFTQRRSCSKVTELWLEEVAQRPAPLPPPPPPVTDVTGVQAAAVRLSGAAF